MVGVYSSASFPFSSASRSQSSLAVARYVFEPLETDLLTEKKKSARSLMTFLGSKRVLTVLAYQVHKKVFFLRKNTANITKSMYTFDYV